MSSDGTHAQGKHGLLFIVSGPSGAGETTLSDAALRAFPDLKLSVSCTTRPPRSGETDGVQYHFVAREEFERRRAGGQFLEWAEVHAHLYGTPRAFVEEQLRQGRVVVLEVDVQGGASVRRAQTNAVSVFICPPSVEALRQRLSHRGTDTTEVIEQRLSNAAGELAQLHEYDYVVWNDDLEPAAARLMAIVDAERSRVGRLGGAT